MGVFSRWRRQKGELEDVSGTQDGIPSTKNLTWPTTALLSRGWTYTGSRTRAIKRHSEEAEKALQSGEQRGLPEDSSTIFKAKSLFQQGQALPAEKAEHLNLRKTQISKELSKLSNLMKLHKL